MRRVVCLSVFLSIALFRLAPGQDTGIADTVRLGYVRIASLSVGDSIGIPLYLFNDEPIEGFSFGFHFCAGNFKFSSWSLNSSLIPPANQTFKETYLPTDLSKFLIGWMDSNGTTPIGVDPTPQARLLGMVYFKVVATAFCQYFLVDSSFVPPAGAFILSSKSGSSITPHFLGFESSCISIDNDGNLAGNSPLPRFELLQNSPNPFNLETSIEYSIPTASEVKLTLYDLLGREVIVFAQGKQLPGRHRVSWNGVDKTGSVVSSGVYFYRISAGSSVATRKMVVLK